MLNRNIEASVGLRSGLPRLLRSVPKRYVEASVSLRSGLTRLLRSVLKRYDYFQFQSSRILPPFAPGSSAGRIFLPPQNHINEDMCLQIVWWKKGTSRKSSAALIIIRIMFYLGFGVLLSKMPGQSHFPLYGEIPRLYSKNPMFSWGTNSQEKCKGQRRNRLQESR